MIAESIFPVFCHWDKDLEMKKKGKDFEREQVKNFQKSAPCEDWTHDLQISSWDYETDALPNALTRHLNDTCLKLLSMVFICDK